MIKHLTVGEFLDLGDGPHDACVVGFPPEGSNYRVQVWLEHIYGWECMFASRHEVFCKTTGAYPNKIEWESFRGDWYEPLISNSFWHKLPPNILLNGLDD